MFASNQDDYLEGEDTAFGKGSGLFGGGGKLFDEEEEAEGAGQGAGQKEGSRSDLEASITSSKSGEWK